MKEKVENIGKDLNFIERRNQSRLSRSHRSGSRKLYALFDVKPVAKRLTHDAVTHQSGQRRTWEEQYEELGPS